MWSGTTRLIGRDDEVAVLAAAIAAGTRGEHAVVCLDGVPGIGRSTLLRHAAELARSSGHLVLTAGASVVEARFAFGVANQLFEHELIRAGGTLSVSQRALLHQVFDPSGAGETDERAALHALYRLAVAAAAATPLFIAIDDLDHADAPSLGWLAYLRRRLDRLPIVLVATTSVGRAATDRALLVEVLSGARRVPVGPLDAAACTRVVDLAFAPAPVAPEFATACATATDGNPFLLGELLRALVDEQVVPDLASLERVRHCGPPWLADRLMTRLRAQDPVLATLTRAVAVLGQADCDLAAAAAQVPVPNAADAAQVLSKMGILHTTTRLALRSAVTQRSVANDVLAVERDAVHARAAAYLHATGASPKRVAAHLLQTASPSGEWVVDTLSVAARDALVTGAPERASVLLRRVLREPLADDARDEILLVLGTLVGGGDAEAGIVHLSAVRGPHAVHAQRLSGLIRAYAACRLARPAAEVATLLRTALDDGQAGPSPFGRFSPPELIRAIELCEVGVTLILADRFDDARSCLPSGPEEPVVRCMANVLSALVEFRVGRVDVSLAAMRTCLREAHELDPLGWLTTAIALPVLIESAVERGELDTAQDALEHSSLSGGMPEYWRYHVLRHSKGKLRAARGEWEEALEEQLECGQRFGDLGIINPAFGAWRSSAAMLHLRLGDHSRAAELAAEELELARAWGAPRSVGVALRAVALVGPEERRDTLLTEAAEHLGATSLELAGTLLAHGEWLIDAGNDADAAPLLERAAGLAGRCGAVAIGCRATEAAARLGGRTGLPGQSARTEVSPHEHRIAGMVVSGLTNHEIGDILGVTSRAVERHLTKIYRKLGIARRSQLSRALDLAAGTGSRSTE